MAEVVEAVAEQRAAPADARVDQTAVPVLLATDACCAAGHDIALLERGGALPALVCVTCAQLWGRREALRRWQAACPDCFAHDHPAGLSDLGITAQPLADQA